jgi:hypothetical protein
MDKAEFWATKSPLPEYHAVTFTHPSFASPIRLVANVYAAVTLGGNVHTPAPMQIRPPETGTNAQPKLTLSFPRLVVGRQFKQQLALIVASGSRAPIVVTYAVYTGDTTAPTVTWTLYAVEGGGVAFNGETVQVSAGLDNPMQRAVAPVYLPETFTGLQGA